MTAASLTPEEFVGAQSRCPRCRSREGRQETIHSFGQAVDPPRTYRLGRSHEYNRYISLERADQLLGRIQEAGT